MKGLTRGKIAKHFNINPETLRYYESEKLISPPKRYANGYRYYDETHMQQLAFINMGKQIGFTLKTIKLLLSLRVMKNTNREKIQTIAKEHSLQLDQKIKQLRQMKKTLDELISLCQKNEGTSSACPILDCLSQRQADSG